MAETNSDRIQAAWQAVWDSASRHYLPTALEDEALKDAVGEAPSFADTGPIMLFNREPWHGVSIDLRANRISGLGSVEGGELSVEGNKFKAEVSFRNLQYTGRYVLQSGMISGSALETAGAKVGLLAASSDDPTERDDLANSYQSELMESDNGRFMVGTYHQFNDCYNQAVTTGPTFNWTWANATTNGKSSEFFANQTNNAAQQSNRGSVKVNADPDYSPHSFFMQTSLKANLFFLSNQVKKSDPVAAQRFLDAGLATSTFRGASLPPSSGQQTVDDVINVVKTGTPPDAVTNLDAANSSTSLRTDASIQPAASPPWLAEADRRAIALHEKLLAEGPPEESGKIHRGTFTSRFITCTLTLVGEVTDDGIRVDALIGNSPAVSIKISHFPPGDLYTDAQDAIDRAKFLQGVLGKRVVSALGDENMLTYLSKLLTQAA